MSLRIANGCTHVHLACLRMFEEDPIMLPLQKDQFSFAENPFVIIGPNDIGQFLREDMLNIALIHVYMRLCSLSYNLGFIV